ncbi:replication initiation protein RepC [Paracoccus sp. MBLB3053]|uniref:Replication initiation protein RepC n=1 Tax=Paracoccus aurantius TaxID=3073814 RepID=A0ABU2HXB8_9RHOB|nr:replication initiation protein RepC [Paracoccus sp. MBLB3053]MDS9469691.1 replication initiation protein RepC [Paracoccus sp. MBLB3053]
MRTPIVRVIYPVLPDGMTLGHVIELVERLARQLGLGAARRAVLLRMMRHTAPADWRDPGCDPVCFRAQQDLARDLGVSDRTLRLHEKGLEALGFIRVDTAANGRRSGRHLSHGRRLGINFRPLLENLGRLLEMDAEHREETHRISVLRLECSAAKRDAKQAIGNLLEQDPKHAALPDLLRRFSSWPRRYAGFRCSEDLACHLAAIDALLAEVRGYLACRPETSAMAEAELPAIGKTTPKNLVRAGSDQAAGRPPVTPRHSKRGNAEETRDRDDLNWLTPEMVREMAGSDFRFCLEALCPTGEITGRSLRSAAIMLLRDLGITEPAWEEALDQLGSLRASLTVLLIEANRDHPQAPVRVPGAMLRDFVARDRRGEFNLSGALKGLWRRKRDAA